ncbi:IS1595 family transposase [Betaproteobacteria bacterium GR16-43]|nr:IS1595 family transposase [Betaproteobacteria bacterium GR16-43]
MSILNQPQFKSAAAAREYLERLRWPDGAVCPHCGSVSKDHYELNGSAHRPGVWKCKDCREQFTVTVGTVFERSKVALNVWLQAVHLLCSSKKGMSTNQLHRTLGVTLKTAWFMAHRIREAMAPNGGGLLGGGGGIVEVDETYIGNVGDVRQPRKGSTSKRGPKLDKRAVVALVERGGEVRAFHVPNVTHATLKTVLGQVSRDAHLMTDEATRYWNVGKEFAQHSSVNHGKKEYARGDVTTNTVEGFFGIFKRGMVGTYHHVSEKHLQRYVNEFAFRYNNRTAAGVNDQQRAENTLKQIAGKRLTYRRPIEAQA